MVEETSAVTIEPDLTLTIDRCGDDDASHRVCVELEQMLDLIRRNEKLRSIYVRTDDEESVTISVSLREHESKKDILQAIMEKARRLAKRSGMKVMEG